MGLTHVLYERRLHPAVIRTLGALLAPQGLALIADPNRVIARGFASELRAAGFCVLAAAAVTDAVNDLPVAGTVFHVRCANT